MYALLDNAEADVIQLGSCKGRGERSDEHLAGGWLHTGHSAHPQPVLTLTAALDHGSGEVGKEEVKGIIHYLDTTNPWKQQAVRLRSPRELPHVLPALHPANQAGETPSS